MRATVMYGPGGVGIENVPDSTIIEPNDALVVVTHAAIKTVVPSSCTTWLTPVSNSTIAIFRVYSSTSH